jgi:hypothetical protein
MLIGETLPSATVGVAYTQNISGQASGGVPPYTFSLLGTAPPGDTWFISSAGVITGTPITQNVLITENGTFLVTETGANLIT